MERVKVSLLKDLSPISKMCICGAQLENHLRKSPNKN